MTWKTPFDIETKGNVNATGSINANSFTDTEDLLSEAVLWLDADYSGGGQTIKNLGRGGRQLDAQNGSTSGEDSNDAKFLNWPGDNAGNYVYLPGVSLNNLQIPDEAVLDITDEIDIRVHLAMDDWDPAADFTPITKWQASGNQRSWNVRVRPGSDLYFQYLETGSTGGAAYTSSVPLSVADGEPLWIRVTWTKDNGTGNSEANFYTSTDGSSWVALGVAQTDAVTVPIFSGSAPVKVGSFHLTGGEDPAKIYRAQILDSIDGTTVLDIDTSVITSGSATSFKALTGQEVSINRSSSGRKSVAVVSPVWLFGTDDQIEVAHNALLNQQGSFTVLALVRQWQDEVAGGFYVAKGSGSGSRLTMQDSSTTDLQLVNTVVDGDSVAAFDASTAFTAGNLVMLELTVDRDTNTMFTSVDPKNRESFSKTYTADIPDNTVPLYIGRKSATPNYQDFEFVGLAIFDRALTQSELVAVNTYYENRVA